MRNLRWPKYDLHVWITAMAFNYFLIWAAGGAQYMWLVTILNGLFALIALGRVAGDILVEHLASTPNLSPKEVVIAAARRWHEAHGEAIAAHVFAPNDDETARWTHAAIREAEEALTVAVRALEEGDNA